MKKFLAALLAVMLVFSLCVTATAAPADVSGNSFTAYQIFKGTQGTGAELANIDWGTGIDSANFLTALKSSTAFGETNPFTSCNTANDVANVIKAWSDNSDQANAFAKLAYQYKAGDGKAVTSSTTLDAGYYLIADTTTFAGGSTGTVRNLALLQLTNKGDLDITSKVDIPVVQKKVKDVNDSVANSTTDWQDSADYDIGDAVPFQLKASLGKIADYDVYKVVFHDTQSNGLNYPTNFVVKIQNTTGNAITLTDSQYSVAETTAGFDVTITDVIALGAKDNAVITVEYTAVLNSGAALGAAGNPNEVYLEYSNNPNWTGTGTTEETGKTPSDKVIVFTYQVQVNKKDQQGQALAGAGFTLYKLDSSTGNYEKVSDELTGSAMEQFVWKGVDDGDYKLVESTVPAGYNKMDDLLFTITAEHDTTSDNPALTSLNGGNLATGDFTATGTIAGDVTNFKGSTLPETGGIGTTIFYAVGAVLVVGAFILLVTKKRMSAEK